MMGSKEKLAFVTDSTLGKLARHLRLVGFDTLVDTGTPDARRLSRLSCGRRIILTRSSKVKNALHNERMVLIHDNLPSAQMDQVMAIFDVRRSDVRPMTRCALCNRVLEPITREQARGRVPDFVWHQHSRFRQCPGCHRIYWQGSHAERWMRRMQGWFTR